jgi:hypothetical protein
VAYWRRTGMALSLDHKLAIGQEFHVIHAGLLNIWTYEYDGSEDCNLIISRTPIFLNMEDAKVALEQYKNRNAWDK